MSPDLALKRVVEWKPTVSRQPRLSAEMKLEISKLKSQKEEIRAATRGDQAIVYGYLDEKGKPYYIGIASGPRRPYDRDHSVPVPSDPSRVRKFGTFSTREKAEAREVYLIARYGRKGIDDGGILLNKSSGGGKSAFGSKRTSEQRRVVSEISKRNMSRPEVRAKVSAASKQMWASRPELREQMAKVHSTRVRSEEERKKLSESLTGREISTQQKRAMSQTRRDAFLDKVRASGLSEQEYRRQYQREKQRAYRAAARQGVKPTFGAGRSEGSTADRGAKYRHAYAAERDSLGLTESQYRQLRAYRRNSPSRKGEAEFIAKLKADANRPAISEATVKIATKYGMDPYKWNSLARKEKNRIHMRYRAGKRGKALLEGLI
jgi:hypothetical protein